MMLKDNKISDPVFMKQQLMMPQNGYFKRQKWTVYIVPSYKDEGHRHERIG